VGNEKTNQNKMVNRDGKKPSSISSLLFFELKIDVILIDIKSKILTVKKHGAFYYSMFYKGIK
jgi:hypothetical protein